MRKSRLSWSQQERLVEHFIAGATARTAAVLVGVNKTTASYSTSIAFANSSIRPQKTARRFLEKWK